MHKIWLITWRGRCWTSGIWRLWI